MADLARLRHAVFRIASEIFLLPGPDRMSRLAEAARELRAETDWLAAFSFFQPVDRFLAALEAQTPEDHGLLQVQYQSLFAPSTQRKPVPLHEAGFIAGTDESSGLMLASIEQHYTSSGVAASQAGPHMPDHVSTELEFLALLCGREAEAWEKGDLKAARRMQDRQRRFMEKHPANWLPALSAALAERDGGIFRQAVEAAHSLVAHDIDFLAALRPRLREGVAG